MIRRIRNNKSVLDLFSNFKWVKIPTLRTLKIIDELEENEDGL